MELKSKVVLVMPNHAGIYNLIIKNLEEIGYEVTYFEEKGFEYKNLGERLNNFFRKTFLRQKGYKDLLRMRHKEKQFSEDIPHYNFYFALVIRPDLYGENIPKYLKNICKKTIAYQWDGFSRFHLGDNIIQSYDTFATFDENDYNQHKDKFPNLVLTQNFYFDYIKALPKEYDFYYIGSLQDDRFNIIKSFSEKLKGKGYHNSFTLFDIKAKSARKIDDINITHKESFYDEILKKSSTAKVIIDLKHPAHNGLSLRFFEALNFSQKVITNNSYIKYTDFYHENNHFIFENIEDLTPDIIEEFYKKPYIEFPNEIKNQYKFKTWLEGLLAHT